MIVQRSHLRIALVVLVIAVAYNVWVFFKPAPRTNQPAVRQQPLLTSQENAPAPAGSTVDPMSIPAPPPLEAAQQASGRDPFLFGDENRDAKSVAASAVRVPDPVVRTILVSATRRTALVENRMLSVGDSIGPLKVVQIDRDAVVFAYADGERRRVELHRALPAGIRR